MTVIRPHTVAPSRSFHSPYDILILLIWMGVVREWLKTQKSAEPSKRPYIQYTSVCPITILRGVIWELSNVMYHVIQPHIKERESTYTEEHNTVMTTIHINQFAKGPWDSCHRSGGQQAL